MSDLMLQAVLRMPPEAWNDGAIDVMQRHSRYVQAADELEALRAALDQEREKVRELAESPPMASISLCCRMVRWGYYAEGSMHDGGCRDRHGGQLGKTYYLHDVSALLSGRGEGEGNG